MLSDALHERCIVLPAGMVESFTLTGRPGDATPLAITFITVGG